MSAACIPCGETFETAADLVAHVQTHGSQPDHAYPEA